MRVYDNARSVGVLCNGERICTYDVGHFVVDAVTYGIMYDNGKVTLLYNGIPVSTANCSPDSLSSQLLITDFEQSTAGKHVMIDNMKLIKY